jgi:lipoprotein-releasing system ATP-binding protein
MLNVANLSKEYPTPRGALVVLSDVSFSLGPGDAAAIMGPSGSGKSSLLYVLGALEPPTSGTVMLDGRDPFQLPAAQLAAFRNESVGFVFQDHCLLPQCTVLENVLIPTLVASGRDDGAGRDTDRARRLVEQVGLSARIDHRPGELSGGERQRVGLARALAVDPPILLMDEPFGALDPVTRVEVRAEFTRIRSELGTTVVVVTHDMAEAFALGERIGVIDAGRLIACDRPQAIVQSTDPRVRRLVETLVRPPEQVDAR